ncbi:SRPBCC family protein [Nonomuraea sp. FMUSA5-5]|uniref:SRPBCC family protein n=1 Tax=Nonomuraea composti TaxID=2720023 RepID=A0ABX1BHS8_9ACTN|nr:SRPBCC family protein [Nonomuraea sp. FMUSA5-5]NJP96059.1 SRPBCC family protein [Nonomuraea sp. FMUSA5-5]
MRIDNDFAVPLPVDDAWTTLLDVGRIAACMPGAELDSVDGDVFSGRVKVKVGPVSLTYKGQAEITGRDAASHVAVLVARGRDARGNGTAGATVTMRLTGDGDRTRVHLLTELDVTGRPAQLGRGVMTEVSNRIINQFADELAAKLATERTTAIPATEHTTAVPAAAAGVDGTKPAAVPEHGIPARPAREINVLSLAGRSLAARLWQRIVRLFGHR